MRRLLLLLVFAFGIVCHAQLAKSYPAPTGYVDDYAHVLSADGSAHIETLCRQIHHDTHAQIFLVTVPSLRGESIEQFSNDLFHQWKIGEKGTDRGLLVVFATGERMHRIEVGYGFEGVLNDAKAGDIGRAITPDLHARRYDQAGLQAVNELAAAVAVEPPQPSSAATVGDQSPPVAPLDQASTTHSSSASALLVVTGLALCVALFVWLLLRTARKRQRNSDGVLYDSSVHGYRPADDIAAGSLFSSDTAGNSSSDLSDSGSSGSSDSGDSFSGGDGGDSGGGGASGSDGDSGSDSGGDSSSSSD